MKKILVLFFTLCLFANAAAPALAQQKPDYEKYGRIAIAVVKEDYPGQAVVDYQYAGRKKISETDVQDSFTFQVKENDKPITVIVRVTHSLNNNKFVNLTVEEQKRN